MQQTAWKLFGRAALTIVIVHHVHWRRQLTWESVFMTAYSASTHPESLRHLVQTLILLSSHVSSHGRGEPVPTALDNFDRMVVNEDAAVFCLERLSNIVEHNVSHLVKMDLWPAVLNHFKVTGFIAVALRRIRY